MIFYFSGCGNSRFIAESIAQSINESLVFIKKTFMIFYFSGCGNSTNCDTCFHHCPKNAIQYGKASVGKGQYYFGKF